jgi:hypothetical protein
MCHSRDARIPRGLEADHTEGSNQPLEDPIHERLQRSNGRAGGRGANECETIDSYQPIKFFFFQKKKKHTYTNTFEIATKQKSMSNAQLTNGRAHENSFSSRTKDSKGACTILLTHITM